MRVASGNPQKPAYLWLKVQATSKDREPRRPRLASVHCPLKMLKRHELDQKVCQPFWQIEKGRFFSYSWKETCFAGITLYCDFWYGYFLTSDFMNIWSYVIVRFAGRFGSAPFSFLWDYKRYQSECSKVDQNQVHFLAILFYCVNEKSSRYFDLSVLYWFIIKVSTFWNSPFISASIHYVPNVFLNTLIRCSPFFKRWVTTLLTLLLVFVEGHKTLWGPRLWEIEKA